VEPDNARVIRRLYEVFNQLDSDPAARHGRDAERKALEFFHPDVEFIQPEIQVDQVELRGREALRRVWDEWLTLWESQTSRIVETVERGQRILVVSRNQFRSREGIELEQVGHELYTFRDGLIVRFQAFLADGDSAREALEQD